MTRYGRQLEHLDDVECVRLLEATHLGRVGLVQGCEPVIVPVNYVFHRNTVVFQTAMGSLLDPTPSFRGMAFEIDSSDPQFHSGWSVLVRGEARPVTDSRAITRLQELPLRAWVPRESNRWVRLWPREITGRRISHL